MNKVTAIDKIKEIFLSNFYYHQINEYEFCYKDFETNSQSKQEYIKFCIIKWFCFDFASKITIDLDFNEFKNKCLLFFVQNKYLSKEELEILLEFNIRNNIWKIQKDNDSLKINLQHGRLHKNKLIEVSLKDELDISISFLKNLKLVFGNLVNIEINDFIKNIHFTKIRNEILEYFIENNLQWLNKYFTKSEVSRRIYQKSNNFYTIYWCQKIISIFENILDINDWKIKMIFLDIKYIDSNNKLIYEDDLKNGKNILYLKLKNEYIRIRISYLEITKILNMIRNTKILKEKFFQKKSLNFFDKYLNKLDLTISKKYGDFIYLFTPMLEEDKFLIYFIKYDFNYGVANYLFKINKMEYLILKKFTKHEKVNQNEFIKLNWKKFNTKTKNYFKKITNFNVLLLNSNDKNLEILNYKKKRKNSTFNKLIKEKIMNYLYEFEGQVRIDDLIRKIAKTNDKKEIRNIESLILREDKIISSASKKIRYYNWDNINIQCCVVRLNNVLNSSNPGLYSVEYFFDRHSDLMNHLYLKDHYELHNFIRKYINYFTNIMLQRMPLILLKTEHKEDFLKEIITKNNLDEKSFYQFLKTNYGLNIDTIKANYKFNIIGENNENKDEENKKYIQKKLDKDGIYKGELKDKYKHKNLESLLSNDFKWKRIIQTNENCVVTYEYFFKKTNIDLNYELNNIERSLELHFNKNKYLVFDNQYNLNINNNIFDYINNEFLIKFICRKNEFLKYEKIDNNIFIIRNKINKNYKKLMKEIIIQNQYITFDNLNKVLFNETKITLNLNMENMFKILKFGICDLNFKIWFKNEEAKKNWVLNHGINDKNSNPK